MRPTALTVSGYFTFSFANSWWEMTSVLQQAHILYILESNYKNSLNEVERLRLRRTSMGTTGPTIFMTLVIMGLIAWLLWPYNARSKFKSSDFHNMRASLAEARQQLVRLLLIHLLLPSLGFIGWQAASNSKNIFQTIKGCSTPN